MSVTFTPSNPDGRALLDCTCDDLSCVACTSSLNLANGNAADLLRWLGLPATSELYGEITASDLAARCRRRLWPETRNEDPEIPGAIHKAPGVATVITSERPALYLRTRTERLLAMADEAQAACPGAVITWS